MASHRFLQPQFARPHDAREPPQAIAEISGIEPAAVVHQGCSVWSTSSRARVEPVLCVLSCGYQGTGDSQVDHRRGILPKQIPVADVTPQDRHGLMPSLLGDRSLAGAGRGRRGRQTSAQAVAGEALAKPPVRLTGGRRPIRWRLPNWRHRRDRGPGPGTVAVLAGRPATLAVSYQAGAAIPCERSGS